MPPSSNTLLTSALVGAGLGTGAVLAWFYFLHLNKSPPLPKELEEEEEDTPLIWPEGLEEPSTPPLHVAIGSTNPTKTGAVKAAFFECFPRESLQGEFIGYSVPSGVSAQPMGDKETRLGAMERARGAFQAYVDAHDGQAPDYAVGLEGGCGEEEGEEGGMYCFAYMCVLDKSNTLGVAKTGSLQLPNSVAALVRGGMELGLADDQVFGRVGSKSGEGAVGLLTKGRIDRTGYYKHAMILALARFISNDKY